MAHDGYNMSTAMRAAGAGAVHLAAGRARSPRSDGTTLLNSRRDLSDHDCTRGELDQRLVHGRHGAVVLACEGSPL